jgi:hypothetical protein
LIHHNTDDSQDRLRRGLALGIIRMRTLRTAAMTGTMTRTTDKDDEMTRRMIGDSDGSRPSPRSRVVTRRRIDDIPLVGEDDESGRMTRTR